MKKQNIKKAWNQFMSRTMTGILALGLLTQSSIGILSVKAAGVDSDMNLGILSIASPNAATGGSVAWSGDYVYFGEYYQSSTISGGKQPIKWKVLDVTGGNGSSSESGAMLLQSDQILDQVAFYENPDNPDSFKWEKSNLANWLNSSSDTVYESNKSGKYTAGGFLTTAFSNDEKAAIMISDGKTTSGWGNFENPVIGGRRIFCLSATDMINSAYGFFANQSTATMAETVSRQCTATDYAIANGVEQDTKSKKSPYWLRSCYEIFDAAAKIGSKGHVAGDTSDYEKNGVVPALNVRVQDIVFSSPADAEKANSFSKIGTSDVNSWKLTLKDNCNFANGTTAQLNGNTIQNHFVSLQAGYQSANITVNHTSLNAMSGQYTDVTAALISTDSNGSDKEILYYGSIQKNTQATTSTVSIPSGLSEGLYKLRIWGEDRNGAQKTDYASAVPYEATIEVESQEGHTHIFEEWKNTTSCTEGTTEKRICKICGYEETRNAQSKEHEWDTVYTIDKQATCTENGSKSIHCKKCNEKKEVTEIPATGHTGGHASCADLAICKVCNQEYGERLSHDFDDSKWAYDAGAHWHKCSNCSSRKDIEEHEWNDGVIIDDPIFTTIKIKVYECKICGMKKTVILSVTDDEKQEGSNADKPMPNPPENENQDKELGEKEETEEKGTEEKQTEEKQTEEKQTEEKQTEEKQTEEKQTEEKQTEEKGTEEKRTEEKQTEEKGIEEKQTEEKQTEEKQTELGQSGQEQIGQTPQTVQTPEVIVGQSLEVQGNVYKVISLGVDGKQGTVSYISPKDKKITKIIIPDSIELQGKVYSVTEIGNMAFRDCKKLKTVTVKDNVIVIGEKAFYKCPSLKKVSLGKGIAQIKAKAFYGCSKMNRMEIKSSKLKEMKVGSKAFTKAGSDDYKKLIVKVPKKKMSAYNKLLKKKGLSSKAKVKK